MQPGRTELPVEVRSTFFCGGLCTLFSRSALVGRPPDGSPVRNVGVYGVPVYNWPIREAVHDPARNSTRPFRPCGAGPNPIGIRRDAARSG